MAHARLKEPCPTGQLPRLHPHGTPPRFSPPWGREAAGTPCASQQGESWLDARQSDPIAPQEVTLNFYERLNDNTSP